MKKDSNYKKPNVIIYFIYFLICKFLSIFSYKTKILKNEIKGLKGSYVVIANHESQIDFTNLTIATTRRMHMVISNSFYQTMAIKPLMDSIRVIPKQQFQTSTSDIKKMKKVIDNEMPLVIYPVGLMSENGLSTDPGSSLSKLLKFLNTDVYVCYTEGSYLTKPKWSKVKRKGQITVDIYKMISKEDLKSISNDDLYKRVRENIDFNSYENQRKNMIPYKNGDNVLGLEYVVYQCPKCKQMKSIESAEHNTLKCSCCGYEVKANKYGFLEGNDCVYDSVADWSMEILNNLKEQINDNFKLCDEVKISMINYKKHRFEEVGFGKVIIDKQNIVLSGKINNEDISYIFPTTSYPMLPFVPGDYVEIQDKQDIYRLKFSDPYNAMIFINVLKIVNNNY